MRRVTASSPPLPAFLSLLSLYYLYICFFLSIFSFYTVLPTILLFYYSTIEYEAVLLYVLDVVLESTFRNIAVDFDFSLVQVISLQFFSSSLLFLSN